MTATRYLSPTVGDRVVCTVEPASEPPSAGEIVDVIRQRHTDDLFQVAWDNHPNDHDLYPATYIDREDTA